MNKVIIEAINSRVLLQFYYAGLLRVVEPYCYGITSLQNYVIRAFQTDGKSESGLLGWKLFDVSKMKRIEVLTQKFDPHRPDYRQGDRGMKFIIMEVPQSS